MLVEFLFDTADLAKVQQHRWHLASNSYLATSVKVADASGNLIAKRELYLHTFLAEPPSGHTVQHITKNGLDNRRSNLRIVPVAIASPPATTKKRSTELPPMCGIKPEDIPKHIWYVHANGYHRDRFAIEFKSEKILWKSSSSKQYSLKEKLEQAKEKLQDFYKTYPHLDPKREEDLIQQLQSSFEAALKAQVSQGAPLQPPTV
jgi:hypothetical protein